MRSLACMQLRKCLDQPPDFLLIRHAPLKVAGECLRAEMHVWPPELHCAAGPPVARKQ